MLGIGLGLDTTVSRGGGAPVDNGNAIVNHANTTVTPGTGDGYTVERTTGGGVWDASAISSASEPGDCTVILHYQAGSFMAGFGLNDPTLSDSYTWDGYKLWFDSGSTIYVFVGSGQVGAGRAFKNYGKLEYIAATDTVNVYTSDDGVAWGAAIETFAAVGAIDLYFDSSLNTAASRFTAKFS